MTCSTNKYLMSFHLLKAVVAYSQYVRAVAMTGHHASFSGPKEAFRRTSFVVDGCKMSEQAATRRRLPQAEIDWVILFDLSIHKLGLIHMGMHCNWGPSHKHHLGGCFLCPPTTFQGVPYENVHGHVAVAQKTRNSKMGCPGKWKHGPKPAVCPSCLILSHTHMSAIRGQQIRQSWESSRNPTSPPL